MLFDGRRKDHDVEADSHAGGKRRVFFDRDVRQQKVEMINRKKSKSKLSHRRKG